MANALDGIRKQGDEPQGLTRVVIPTQGGDVVPQVEDGGADNSLMRAITPEPSPLIQAIQQLREYLTRPGGFSEGHPGINQIADYLTTDAPGRPRLQLWPERMIRSGLTLAGDVMSGRQPVIDPETGHTAESLTERAQDMAGLAFPGALAQRPGSATLGSGPVRRANMPESLYRIEKSEAGNMQLYGTPGKDVRVVDPMNNKVHYEDSGPGSWERAQDFWRKNSKASWDVVTGDTSGHYEPVIRFPSKRAAEKWVKENSDKPMAPGGATLMSDSGTPGSAVAGAAKSASPFYSALEHAVTGAAQDTMSPQQWAGFLKNQPGVKAEELAWTGVGDWLAQQKGPVKKADVQRYLDEHKVEIKDITKQAGSLSDNILNETADEYINHSIDAFRDKNGRAPTRNEIDGMRAEIVEDIRNSPQDYGIEGEGTKYSSYQLPGGENYREHLLTLPQKKQPSEKFLEDNPDLGRWTDAQRQEFNRLEFNRLEAEAKNPEYRSSHWDEPNVLAHVRTNERDVGGKPSLHIEEVQSDWHQQGRKQGYRPENEKKLADLVVKRDGMLQEVREKMLSPLDERYKEIYRELPKLQTEINKLGSSDVGVPDAPFKTAWPELALKRMIRMAAEEGKGRISWTPGEAQAARYDLSKQLNKVVYTKEGHLIGYGKNDQPVINKAVPEAELEANIGKEAAKKLLDQKPDHTEARRLEGLDLKVGGEGMREFYDKMLPKMVEKLGKAHGVKVHKTEISDLKKIRSEPDPNNPGRFRVMSGDDIISSNQTEEFARNAAESTARAHRDRPDTASVWYFDIPPAWRDQAIGKGFPLFAQGIPWPLVPVDHDPFAKKEKP